MYNKLKMQKECIKTDFLGQEVPYDLYRDVAVVIKAGSVYKLGKNDLTQIYFEQYK